MRPVSPVRFCFIAFLSASKTQWVTLALALAIAGSGACVSAGTDVVSAQGKPSRTLVLDVGQELQVTLGTVGPGEYSSPAISTSVLRFLDVSFVSPYIPAGPRQRFRFQAEAPGQVVLLFEHTGDNAVVRDTVIVR